jgi:hypothetical protein
LSPAAGIGRGPNKEGMFEGFINDDDKWTGLLRSGAEEFGDGMKPGDACITL